MLNAQGVSRPANTAPTASTPSALSIYKVKDSSPMQAIFISSANFVTPGTALVPDALPFGAKAFVAFRRGGDGLVYQGAQATNTTLFFDTVYTALDPKLQ